LVTCLAITAGSNSADRPWSFEALYKDHPERGLLKSIVGEEYILERCEDGKVRYVQYNSTFFAPLPDSAPFDIR